MYSTLLSLLFPPRCIGCNTSGTALCQSCIRTIPFALDTDHAHTFAVYDYSNPLVARAIYNLKYYRRKEAACTLMQHAAPHIAEFISNTLHSGNPERLVFVPIPQYKNKTHARGFNQSYLLARELSNLTPRSTVLHLLRKYRATKPQAQVKQKHARLHNIAHSMISSGTIDAHAVHIILDDVTTTGATVGEAMRALRDAGAKKLLAVTLAHGYARRN